MAIDWDGLVLSPLMSADIFGETLQPTYTPRGGQPFQIDGVFDDGFRSIEPMGVDGVEISTHTPVLGVRLSQFPAGVAPTQGDKVSIPSTGKLYTVRNARPDGKGWVLCELGEAGA